MTLKMCLWWELLEMLQTKQKGEVVFSTKKMDFYQLLCSVKRSGLGGNCDQSAMSVLANIKRGGRFQGVNLMSGRLFQHQSEAMI